MMRVSYGVIVAVLLVAGVYFGAQRGGASQVTQMGDEVSIAIGRHRLQGTVLDPEYCDSFLVVGGMTGSDFFFTAHLSVIQFGTAEALAEQYGNFRRCGSPGASAAKKSVDHMALFAANGKVERRLKHINRLALQHKSPVFKMTFAELDITRHTVKQMGHEIEVVSHGAGPFYLVRKIEIIEEDRAF
jgi:hypothetical protein